MKQKKKSIKSILAKIWNALKNDPKPPTPEQQLKKVYQNKYDTVFLEERKKFLEQQAELDAKKAAKKKKFSLMSLLTGGRG